ncbi:unnamed protein product, partial [Ectocarpus sp. 12 AP-2014]
RGWLVSSRYRGGKRGTTQNSSTQQGDTLEVATFGGGRFTWDASASGSTVTHVSRLCNLPQSTSATHALDFTSPCKYLESHRCINLHIQSLHAPLLIRDKILLRDGRR